ncbi:hypothetical protein VitviT2T_021896 [Vitis vinifera]|nr:LOB domain-containing protein 41 [Vitis vinifera]WKA03809.1 hypothetical protein VitviT2T_021896 [Vitis vinifera]CAN72182.1 hypothetical protein VITISV_004355 [Vitis vinifera]|eukprot:XP_002283795.1 PREDICTED: LOB domain-containing protein 41 [Vitis vinifera]
MRMSCNGCRVLRKGCSDNCTIRPCLQWIKTPESQANATVFLAKFYGRAGLMNLINSGPEHLRPAIFSSLLYEACGRIVNPIYGSVGLLWSGSWHLCQAAVEAVLKGEPITQITSEAAATGQGPPLKAYDIRHVSKDENSAANDLHRAKNRCRFKRSGVRAKSGNKAGTNSVAESKQGMNRGSLADELNRSTSHDSTVSHPSEPHTVEGESRETVSMVSVETAEPSFLFRAEQKRVQKPEKREENRGLELELTLGLGPIQSERYMSGKTGGYGPSDGEGCKMEM